MASWRLTLTLLALSIVGKASILQNYTFIGLTDFRGVPTPNMTQEVVAEGGNIVFLENVSTVTLALDLCDNETPPICYDEYVATDPATLFNYAYYFAAGTFEAGTGTIHTVLPVGIGNVGEIDFAPEPKGWVLMVIGLGLIVLGRRMIRCES